jgi:hypothetical protein
MNRPKGKENGRKRTPKKRTLESNQPKVKRMTIEHLEREINKTPINEMASLRFKQMKDRYIHKLNGGSILAT